MKNAVGIVIGNAAQFYSTKPFYDALIKEKINCDFLLPNWDTEDFRAQGFYTMQKELEECLNKNNVPFLTADNDMEYQIVMSPYPEWWEPKSRYRIKYRYGYASLVTFSCSVDTNITYDRIFCYGMDDANLLSAYSRTCIVGECKMLDYERDRICINEKPVLLYAPTYGEISSIDMVSPYLEKLSEKYSIVIKAHHGTNYLTSEKNDWSELTSLFSKVYDANESIFELLKSCDVVLSDNSGAIFDAMAAGVPVARCTKSNPVALGELETKLVNLSKSGIIPTAFSAENLEQILETALLPETLQKQDEAIKQLYCNPQEGMKNFLSLIGDMFSEKENDGYSILHKQLISMYNKKNTLDNDVALLNTEQSQIKENYEEIIQNNAKKYEQEISNLQIKGKDQVREMERLYQQMCDKYSIDMAQSQKEFDEIVKRYKQECTNHEIISSDYQKQLYDIQMSLEGINSNRQSCNNDIWWSAEYALRSSVYRIAYLFHRMKSQAFHQDKNERKAFWRWFRAKVCHCEVGIETAYNPLRKIQTIVESQNVDPIKNFEIEMGKLSDMQREILQRPYQKSDIIIFGVIDYDFRYQRPQHFAERFAKNGHRVFYINASFHRTDGITCVNENLYMVNLRYDKYPAIYQTDFYDDQYQMEKMLDQFVNQFCISDAITIVDYPNWINTALFLRSKYGFKFVTDYMDDFTGFLSTTGKNLCKNCKMLLTSCDMVVASSQFLYNIAIKYNDHCSIIRNGTEFTHFNSSLSLKKKCEKKVIGYYGAVAHWFDYKKICYLSDRFPECDIHIIGDVTEWKEPLSKCKNVKLFGEKPYKELPNYLVEFDVCLIPFDTSTDLIKATNPVKFYEYLSAGKKIVATEIPELMPFRDKYVYMANEDEKFGDYVEKCLCGMDSLAGKDDAIKFAKENDWQHRYEKFYEGIFTVVPKISIVIITYNNLAYNKSCLKSIQSKTAYANYEIIIVDNLSTDGTRRWLKQINEEKNPKIKIIFNEDNLGFAGGNNIGIKAASGDYVMLLNNDTIVTRGWLTNMVKHMENNESIGMVGSVTNSIGNEAMIPIKYSRDDELREASYVYTKEHMGVQYVQSNMLAMFCTLIRGNVIKECGLLDERYGIGMFEDDDYSEAVHTAGYRTVIAEDAFVHHFKSLSFSAIKSDSYQKLFNRNKVFFEDKWKHDWTAPKYREGINELTNADTKIILEVESETNK